MAKATRLAPEQLRALDQLRRIPSIEQFYLAGGSAIAWHLGHRQSVDLDLFSRSPERPSRPFSSAPRRFEEPG